MASITRRGKGQTPAWAKKAVWATTGNSCRRSSSFACSWAILRVMTGLGLYRQTRAGHDKSWSWLKVGSRAATPKLLDSHWKWRSQNTLHKQRWDGAWALSHGWRGSRIYR